MNPQPPSLFMQNSDKKNCFSVPSTQAVNSTLSSPISTQLSSFKKSMHKKSMHEKVNILIQLSEVLGVNNSCNNSTNNSTDNNARNHYSHPCLLLSRSELNKPDPSGNTARSQQAVSDHQGFSFLMFNPSKQKHLCNEEERVLWQQQVSIEANKAAGKPTLADSSLSTYSQSSQHNMHIPFHSGWVGYYAYPNTYPKEKAGSSTLLLAEFYYYPWSICLDHNSGLFHLLGNPDSFAIAAFDTLQQNLQEWPQQNQQQNQQQAQKSSNPQFIKELAGAPFDSRLFKPSPFKAHPFKAHPFIPAWGKADYDRAFYKIQDYLKAGDCYQVNLTQPHQAKYTGSALSTVAPLYSALNPSFGCYFEGRDCELVSVSPERFMSINAKGRIEAKPIKGTIKRSSNQQQDQHYINELTHSSKNQAENLMIVDLLRNDLSMSAETNSVKVEKLFELETHPNVHHLVSTISAQLKVGLTPADAITKAFPGGSITGAPKKRAMEIIEELEAQPRSLYCGSFGYYSDSGHADFNILIRSVEFRGGVMTCWGGGGITVDSDCDEEYEESLTKVRKIMEVIEGL